MTCFGLPPPPTPERALEMLALCRTKIADLEREIGRISARAALIGNYLALAEAGIGYRVSGIGVRRKLPAAKPPHINPIPETRRPKPDARRPKPDP